MSAAQSSAELYVGVMTGTSMDAIDVALIELGELRTLGHCSPLLRLKAFRSEPMDRGLADALMGLQSRGEDELHRAALVANSLSDAISQSILALLSSQQLRPAQIQAAGVHGQTVRHRPELGYSLQLLTPARIAELTGLTIVSDFRSRDIAAGGQGAPLVPGFHAAIAAPSEQEGITAIVNIGGMANISWLSSSPIGFDSGPGNVLMDYWAATHLGQAFDQDGAWAARGQAQQALLDRFRAEPFFSLPAPKSTGRDLFNPAWLRKMGIDPGGQAHKPEDVQASLLLLTAQTISAEIARLDQAGQNCARVLVCGGGARNLVLMQVLEKEIHQALGRPVSVESTAAIGWDPQVIEASAFAWLAARSMKGQAGNAPSVTGAIGPRILGALTPGALPPRSSA
jgi:anhydro-N-acetylmuramic acid kinase